MKKFNYFLSSVLLTIAFIFPASSFARRVEGPIVFYTFETVENDTIIRDVSGVEPIIDLTMSEEVTKLEGRNGVNIKDDDNSYQEGLYADGPSPALAEKIMASGAFTVEAWIAPIHDQLGECRVFSYSENAGSRNVTLLIKLENTEMRTRTAINGNNGFNMAWLTGPVVTQVPPPVTHLLYTFDGGDENVYLNGELLDSRSVIGGDLSGWDDTHEVIIGTEHGNDAIRRQFKGDIYMVAVYDKALTSDEVAGNFAAGSHPPVPRAHSPMPANDATDVSRDVLLSWTPGTVDGKSDVYFGTQFADVDDGTALVSPAQDVNVYDPGRLEFDTTHFWRIDDVQAVDATVTTGEVWRFTTEPEFLTIPGASITATASPSEPDAGPEKTIDRSGMDDNDLHSSAADAMWLSQASEPGLAWIQYEFDKPYKLQQMRVWNFNAPFLTAFGLMDVTIQYSTDGATWSEMSEQFAQASGQNEYASNTTVDFGGVAAKMVKITAQNNWASIAAFNQYGLSEVQFLAVPVSAREPSPASGATDVAVDEMLSWRAGREASEHNVYISDDEQSVIDGTVPAETVSQASYGPLSLDLGSIYYWRVDEVNNVNVDPVWEGDVWQFSTLEYFVVDDFEDYNDFEPDEVWRTWVDGYVEPPNVRTNGSTAGYPEPDFEAGEHYVETGTVHSGKQSMPLFYDNTGNVNNSEVTRTFDTAQDWTRAGINTLTLYVYGQADNVGGQLYVKVNGIEKAVDVDLTSESWQEVKIELGSLGTNLQRVTSLAVSIRGAGSGMVFVDDVLVGAPLE